MFSAYLRALYERTMAESYAHARRAAAGAMAGGGKMLDCGAWTGGNFHQISKLGPLDPARYVGVEWDGSKCQKAREAGLDVRQGDLNDPLPFQDGEFQCVIGLSVLEHLVKPCQWLRECRRVLAPGGRLVILTPNVSTWFVIAQLAAGRMPSVGPHPDSAELLRSSIACDVQDGVAWDVEGDCPGERHFVVFSYLTLRTYLRKLGFAAVEGAGFGLYPFPNFTQPLLEKLDPYHCHQMVFVATR